jgi:A/G-specific adenine glycosylase
LKDFAPTLEHWYDLHRRDLPWRNTQDPYLIWLSEVILQQTRVTQGLPYYQRFVEAYPTVIDLARADERDLLRLWQGLGYYARARNLYQTAQYITNELNGELPQTYANLLTLKGIGTYTAAAVASFAFGERVAVVDGNVYRVLARVFGIDDDITTTGAKKTFAALAQKLIERAADPATYNQAIMEFGAIQCTPVAPDCLLCPLQQQCNAYNTGRQAILPVKAKKAPVRERWFQYVVFRQTSSQGQFRLAMQERTARDIWQNLYEFYLQEAEPQPVGEASLPINDPFLSIYDLVLPADAASLVAQGTQNDRPTWATQLLTHQRIKAVFFVIDLADDPNLVLSPGLAWYDEATVRQLPKPVIITNFVEKLLA